MGGILLSGNGCGVVSLFLILLAISVHSLVPVIH